MNPASAPKARWVKYPWLLVIAFLLGLIPPLFGMLQSRGELNRTREELQIARQDLKLAQVRALAGQVYLETSRNNFGTAGQIATELFVRAQELSGVITDERRQKLEYILNRRTKLTSDLAAASGEARATAEDILAAIQPATPRPSASVR
jgi:hypothetical protein